MWWRPTIGIMIQVQSLPPAFEHLKGIQECQRAEAGCHVSFQIWSNRIIIFNSSETYSNFIIHRISKRAITGSKKKGGGNLHFTQPTKKIPPISANLTSSKDGCYSFEALRSWSWYNLPRHYCPNSVEPQGWWRVGDARFGVFFGRKLRDSLWVCDLEGLKVYDLTYSTEFRCVWYTML